MVYHILGIKLQFVMSFMSVYCNVTSYKKKFLVFTIHNLNSKTDLRLMGTKPQF